MSESIIRIKNPKGLSVRVDMRSNEVKTIYTEAIRMAKLEAANNNGYYKAYLRQMIPDYETQYDKIIPILKTLRNDIQDRMDNPDYRDVLLVNRLIKENKYIGKNTRRPGLIVKMFHTYYKDREVFIKVYLYDPKCESYRSSFTENFKNEIMFQSYATQLRDFIDFISPELYSWGKIRKFVFDKDGYPFECLYIIMEYIPFVTLKEAVYSTEQMRHIYERVNLIDSELSSHMLHHNDLHSGNIMVSSDSPSIVGDKSSDNKSPSTVGDKSPSTVGDKSPSTVGDKSPSTVGDKSPYPEIVIFDFGEASLGPTKPLFKPLKNCK